MYLYCDLIRDMMYVYDLEITLGSLDEDRVDILLIEFVQEFLYELMLVIIRFQ